MLTRKFLRKFQKIDLMTIIYPVISIVFLSMLLILLSQTTHSLIRAINKISNIKNLNPEKELNFNIEEFKKVINN